ncbi:hypothetical protein MKW92_010653 [Papaver armeniacum]|nr:hypothetical protein MKW92_010653 [Papaver armeniacum]
MRMDFCWWFWIFMKKLRFHANAMNLFLNFSALSAFIGKVFSIMCSSSFWIRVGLANSKYEAAHSLIFPLFDLCSGITVAYAHTAASNFQFTLFYNPSSLGLISLVSLRKVSFFWLVHLNILLVYFEVVIYVLPIIMVISTISVLICLCCLSCVHVLHANMPEWDGNMNVD